MSLSLQPRFKAACTHLAASSIVACLVLLLVFKIWYPAPWADVLHVRKIFLLVLGVDLCLGPLLTLLVFKIGKPSLRKDLITIACIQLAALGYGIHTVGQVRPAFLVFSKGRFDLVQAHEVYKVQNFGSNNKTQLSLLPQNPWVQPLVGLEVLGSSSPQEDALKELFTFSALRGISDVTNVLDLHVPYANVLQDIKTSALKLKEYAPRLESNKIKIQNLRKQYPHDALLSPVKVKFEILTAVLNPNTGDILGIEPVDVFE